VPRLKNVNRRKISKEEEKIQKDVFGWSIVMLVHFEEKKIW